MAARRRIQNPAKKKNRGTKAKTRQLASFRNSKDGYSFEDVAIIYNVGLKTVKQATQIIQDRPDLEDQVFNGTITLNNAMQTMKADKNTMKADKIVPTEPVISKMEHTETVKIEPSTVKVVNSDDNDHCIEPDDAPIDYKQQRIDGVEAYYNGLTEYINGYVEGGDIILPEKTINDLKTIKKLGGKIDKMTGRMIDGKGLQK